jgi:3-hydroxymyristoyl/3-hydroxydecanoyl-(acyl carrier protein) dehydratase
MRIANVIVSTENQQRAASSPVHALPLETVALSSISSTNTSTRQSEPGMDASARQHRQAKLLGQHAARLTDSHKAFLETRHDGLQHLSDLIRLQIMAAQQALQAGQVVRPRHVVWDEDALLEFASGKIANVFGKPYAIIDTYARRVRLPMPPYLLVSRVTCLEAERGHFQPSFMQTEYDIPQDAWYAVDGQIPVSIAVESGQCDLLLISYLGIDFENEGQRVYRLLDCTLTFLGDLPMVGETLRYDIHINRFARSGDNLLFFFSYECYVRDRMVLKMHGGCAGFFSDAELAQGKGIVTSADEQAERRTTPKRYMEPFLLCPKSSFDVHHLIQLSQGDLAGCFGAPYAQSDRNPSLRLPPPAILMIDRVVSVEPHGGAWGLGLIVAEKTLAPDHWYFPCHFKDDQVLAGSLIAEGCTQLLQFYLLYLGLQTHTQDARFQPIPDLQQVVRCRGQVVPTDTRLTYRMEITDIGLTPQPYAKARVDIILDGSVIVDFKDLGLQLSEKRAVAIADSIPQAVLQPDPIPTAHQPVLFGRTQIEAFASGSIVDCFGPEYQCYEGRRTPRIPNGDLQLVSRVVGFEGQRHDFKQPACLVTEYDVPSNPWFCHHNSHPAVLPYSICMEIALQPCGFLSAYMGTSLMFADMDFYFRNLDGEATLLNDTDLRGRTLTNRVQLLSTTAFEGTIIQSFAFALTHDQEPFYQGTASFGYFTAAALANQVGLDGGAETRPWDEQDEATGLPCTAIDLRLSSSRQQWYGAAPSTPYYRLADGQLDFLDEIRVVPGGGAYRQGYIYARQKLSPTAWYFSCHFYQDPVMPGSLGIEAILQAMQMFALHQNLGQRFTSPCFTPVYHHQVVWKYRGQIPPTSQDMALEVHITRIEVGDHHVKLTGDASLWNGSMRIYEVNQAAIGLSEATALKPNRMAVYDT